MKKNERNAPFFVLPIQTALCLIAFFILFLCSAFFFFISLNLLLDKNDTRSFFGIVSFAVYSFLAGFGCIVFWKKYLCHFLVKTKITENGIVCIRYGKQIKTILWSEVVQVVSIHLIDYTIKMDAPLVLISGHEITEQERLKAREQIGKKNDFFVLPFDRKTLKAIPKILRPKRVPTVTRQIRFWPPEW